MSDHLTGAEFHTFVSHFDETMRANAETLHAIASTLADHTKRLDRIENILWDGQRVTEIERRLIQLAETVGRPDLATPITRPIGA